MTTRLPSLRGRPTTFAAGFGMAAADEGLPAVVLAILDTGAHGLEVAVHSTRDGHAVVSDTASVGSRFRRRRIAATDRSELGSDVIDLTSLVDAINGRLALLLTISSVRAFDATLEAVRPLDPAIESGLWLAGTDVADLIAWRPRTSATIVYGTRLSRVGMGMESMLAELHAGDINAVSMFHSDWSGGTIALAHRFGILAVGAGATHEREMAALVDGGIDALSSDNPTRMAAIVAEYYR